MVGLSSCEWQPQEVATSRATKAQTQALDAMRLDEMKVMFMGEIYDGLSAFGGTGS
jgi:hypothetical protein